MSKHSPNSFWLPCLAVLSAAALRALAWDGEQVDFPSSLNEWRFTCPVTKFTGVDGSTEWFRYHVTALSTDPGFQFKMVLNNSWGYDFGGNPAFAKNELGIMYYHPGGNSQLTGGVQSGFHYLFTVKNPGLADTFISVMELSGDPVPITGVTGGQGSFSLNQTVPIAIYFADPPPPEERAYVRMTTNNWDSFFLLPAVLSGQVARVVVSNLQAATEYQWYALASSASPAYLARQNAFTVDALSLTWLNNYGVNYKFITGPGSAAWVFHDNDRVVDGSKVQFWAKIGYCNGDGSNPWVTNAAVYLTTDGSVPEGGYGVAGTTSTRVLPMKLDHLEKDTSQFGAAMKWVATSARLPAFTPIRYKIGAWMDQRHVEHFADYNSGFDKQVFSFQLGILGDPVLTVESEQNGLLNADYTVSRFFIDEVRGERSELRIDFQPGDSNVVAAEVYSNLNRRDWADQDGNGDGVADGILPPAGDLIDTNSVNQYYAAYTLKSMGGGHYQCTLPVEKTGAYRLTARWKVSGDTSWRWYSYAGRRDHAVVVSPSESRSVRLYELNAMTVAATDATEAGRSTFEELREGPDAAHSNRWSLEKMKRLGCNWLWFQPIHPAGLVGREINPETGTPCDPGSPYAVKNYFEIAPRMSRGATRTAAMAAFTNFMGAADKAGLNVMLEVPFSHAAIDCELAAAGASLLVPGAADTEEIRNREARFFSRSGNYAMRASSASDIALAPDRGDFGKWSDVRDVYFGRYPSLVDVNPANNGNYLNEEDWFDTSVGEEGVSGKDNGHFDAITRSVWRYFASYVSYWLDRTGYPRNPSHAVIDSHVGIDGLRANYAQGVPAQCWEYVINVARARRWNFIFMGEAQDGGVTSYRSNRQFDILHENLAFSFRNAMNEADYRACLEQRRSAYGQGLVLLNTVSHDEENYSDPWQAITRMAVAGSVDGATMVFYGQELGASRSHGFAVYDTVAGRQIPSFKVWNSLAPAANSSDFGLRQAFHVIAAINVARAGSPALQGPNRYFLAPVGGAVQPSVWAVAKYEEAYASPNSKEVVFAFANLDRYCKQAGFFNLNVGSGGTNLFGLKPDRYYNVRNLAALEAFHPDARSRWLWAQDKSGAELLSLGLYVDLNAVPVTEADWRVAPYEAQYLKLFDMTVPAPPGAPLADQPYAVTNRIGFNWSPAGGGGDGEGASYILSVGTTPGASDVVDHVNVGRVTRYTTLGQYGTTNYATLWAVSPAGLTSLTASASSAVGQGNAPVILLRNEEDSDHDGISNGDEARAGTDPLDPGSLYRVVSMSAGPGEMSRAIATGTVPGKTYRISFNDVGISNDCPWVPFGNTNNGVGSWFETNRVPTMHLFVDDESADTTGHSPKEGKRYYRIQSK